MSRHGVTRKSTVVAIVPLTSSGEPLSEIPEDLEPFRKVCNIDRVFLL